jgi:prepilin-type N-terminal cleavage/methylation domain-containing protein
MIRKASRVPGFTLIELMCAMVIGSIILLTAASLLGSSGEGYERVSGGVASEREARAAINQLNADLATAQFHPESKFLKSNNAWPDDEIGFLCLQPAQAQAEADRIGDLCAVYYYLDDLTLGGKSVRCLMRGFRSSSKTFEALEFDNVDTALFIRDSVNDEPIAFGVVAFEARPKEWDTAAGQWRDWKLDPLDPGAGPQAHQVRLVVARRDLAGRLKTPADWSGGGQSGKQLGSPSEADRNANLEVYEAMIRFGNHETF